MAGEKIMRGGGHSNFHREIFESACKTFFSSEFSSWLRGIGVLCLGTVVDLRPFFLEID